MAKKRANGEGNIRKRKDGRWEGRYTAGADPETGKPIAKSVLAKTQRECKEKLQKAAVLYVPARSAPDSRLGQVRVKRKKRKTIHTK